MERVRSAVGSVVGVTVRVLRAALLGALVMVGLGLLLAALLPAEGLWAQLGKWSLLLVYGVAGLVGGLVLGLNAEADRGVARFIEHVRGLLGRITPEEAERLVPRVAPAEARSRYERALDGVVEQSVGGVRLPSPLRRLLRHRLRRAAVENFLAECEARGLATVGFAELRDYLVTRGLPLVAAPAVAQLRTARLLVLGAGGLLIAIGALAALPSTWPLLLGRLPALLAVVGVAVVGLGWMEASRYESPSRRRLGMVVLGLSIAAWPALYARLLEQDLGMAWLVVLAATVAGFGYGLRQAFVEAYRPRVGLAGPG